MKKVYIILTYTGTWLAKIVRYYTKREYSHVSISLDENLQRMYSFGRKNPYIAFWGGFVHESAKYGTFKRFKNTKALIYQVYVSEEQYERLSELILKFKKKRKLYRFNVLGLMGVAFSKKRKKENYFYCAEFVQYMLEQTKVVKEPLPEVIKPEDFKKVPDLEVVFEGILKEYQQMKDKEKKVKRKQNKKAKEQQKKDNEN